MRIASGGLASLLVLAACDNGTGPPTPPPLAVRIAYLESGVAALQIVVEGKAPSTTSVQDAVPFASFAGGLVLARQGGLSRYYVDGSSITVPAFIGVGAPGGATSPDGTRLAYSKRTAADEVYFHLVDLETGEHDSLVISGRQDVPAAADRWQAASLVAERRLGCVPAAESDRDSALSVRGAHAADRSLCRAGARDDVREAARGMAVLGSGRQHPVRCLAIRGEHADRHVGRAARVSTGSGQTSRARIWGLHGIAADRGRIVVFVLG